MSPATFAQPPVDMVMPAIAQLVATICLGAVAAVMFAVAVVHWARARDPLYVLGILGGLLASVNEPFTNVVGMCYHPARGQWPVLTSFDRPIPVWAVLCYPVFFGGLSCLLVAWLRRGITRRSFWRAVAVVMAGNAAFEFPILAAHVYVYYGDQPYRFFGMQPAFFVINVLGAVLGALGMAHFWPRLAGPGKLAILLIPGVAQVAAYGIAAPHMFTLNTDLPLGYKYAGTTLTIVLGLVAIDQLGRYAARRFGPADIPTPADRRELEASGT